MLMAFQDLTTVFHFSILLLPHWYVLLSTSFPHSYNQCLSQLLNMPLTFPLLGLWWSCFLLHPLFYEFFKASLTCIFSRMHSYTPPDGIISSLPKAHWSLIHAWCLRLFLSCYSFHNAINSSVQRHCLFFILPPSLEKCLIHRMLSTNLYGKELKEFHELPLFPMYISK